MTKTTLITRAEPSEKSLFNKKETMEFLIPHIPSSRHTTGHIPIQNGVGLIRSVSTSQCQQKQQEQQKMTKKELKMAQAQLNKMSQINIHLHGRFFILFYYLFNIS